MKKLKVLIPFLFLSIAVFSQSGLVVKMQKSGPVKINSYLIFDPSTKKALVIDTGSQIDSLVDIIKSNKLVLKYIFLTHAHQDHIVGLNKLKGNFPSAKVGLTKQEFENIVHYKKWREVFTKEDVDYWQKDSNMCHLMDFDYNSVNKPDIFLVDNQSFDLGTHKIVVIYTPGHSTGSVTISIDKFIFPGDLLLYNTTGQLDYFLCSEKDIFESIQKLYKTFPDEAIIYAGHGKPSTIGYEKVNNKCVTKNTNDF